MADSTQLKDGMTLGNIINAVLGLALTGVAYFVMDTSKTQTQQKEQIVTLQKAGAAMEARLTEACVGRFRKEDGKVHHDWLLELDRRVTRVEAK